jgi:HK97 family phage prohead protease
MKIERRTFKVELRAKMPADGSMPEKMPMMSGRAVVFGQLSENLGGFREQIDPAAMDGCDMSDVRCLFNHEDSTVLGRTASGTLRLSVNSEGVDFECDPPMTMAARDLCCLMERGDVNQCSFSFTVAPSGAEWSEDPETGTEIRTVKKIARLYDVSVVTYPAYTQTSSEIRSYADILAERPKPEEHTAGQQAPPASSGGVAIDLLRRKVDLLTISE